jgi:hypothetical protein
MSNIVDDFIRNRLYNGIVKNCREPSWKNRGGFFYTQMEVRNAKET